MQTAAFYVVVGLGASGLASARYLHKKGIPLVVMDTRDSPPFLADFNKELSGVTLVLGRLDASLLLKASCVVVSPGMSLELPELAACHQKNIPLIGDVELFAREVNAPVIAITGTNAKSTVTTLVGDMAKASGLVVKVGGNLGVPTLDLLSADTELYVLELSSFQLESTYSLKPAVATILNVTEDHMDRYADLAAYRAAKLCIYHNAKNIVCNRDDRLTEPLESHAPKMYFSTEKTSPTDFCLRHASGEMYLAQGEHLLMKVSELHAKGKHDCANALAALAIIHAYGLPLEPALNVLKAFQGLPHRCQLVREANQIKWYNDSKGTNVGATCAAIQGLGDTLTGKIILIAGGVGKDADFSPLLPVLKKYVRHVVLIGEAANEINGIIKSDIPTSFSTDMSAAILQAKSQAKSNDVVLLSPACASFDMFKNYAHRGEVFTQLVMELI